MSLTPMMQQYIEVKEGCKDCILFFRLGDFYEMFFEDAENASRELELVLTGRECGLERKAPMCGIPYHAANNYISRLVNKGYKIAICEQLEDPSASKGIVKRGIIKVITPGTYTDSSFLQDNKNNYIMSLYIDKDTDSFSLSFADISTGDFNSTYSNFNLSVILDEISKYSPSEILLQESIDEKICVEINERFNSVITKLSEEYFYDGVEDRLKEQFKEFNKDEYNDLVVKCSGGLLKYILDTQKTILSNINELQYYNIVDYMTIDISSRRNLELTETLREKSKKGSLLWVLDKTSTAMGGRQLRKWIEQPLIHKESIQNRLNAVEELIDNINSHQDLKDALRDIYDIERLVGKISSKSVTAKELISLKNSIEKIPSIKELLLDFKAPLLSYMHKNLDDLKDVYDELDKSISDNPAIGLKEGNLIKAGYNEQVDELKSAKAHGKEWISSLENNEKEITGIKSLKVGYNKVFGYYIEITKSNLSSIPEGRYIRKQTLSNAERYITPELKEMEEKILGAEEKLINLEYELFVEVRENIEKQVNRMQKTARTIAELDCLSSLAFVALENNYCKPNISSKQEIKVEEGRHPVIEKMIPFGSFISNDTHIDTKEEQMLLITGPNMAGKSTYMRQVALLTLMAQIGSFVPAKSAVISICDKIFTRIGASDDLAAGKSTFMVEMWEVSNILKNATNQSLILLDEVGRGTSTYDGLSIAWSVIEYICGNSKLKCKTLFATHYHELTKLEGLIEGVKNYSVAVKEMGSDIVFLRKIVKGGADQSYGIEVAKLAGLPEKVIVRAKEILQNIEGEKIDAIDASQITNTENVDENKNKHKDINKKVINESNKIKEVAVDIAQKDIEAPKQLDFDFIEKENLIKDLASIDILNMTPMDGFNRLYDIIKKAKNL